MSEAQSESKTHILLVDDDAELCELVGRYLTARGFEVDVEGDGARGLERAESGHYTLLVLDVMLPTLDGFEILRRLRSNSHLSLPVVMLTAHGDEVDRIVGLELGADDYLPKPFNPRELLARIRAILRRAGLNQTVLSPTVQEPNVSAISQPPASVSATPLQETSEILSEGGIRLNIGGRSVECDNNEIDLTATEFDLLHLLLREAGRVVRREDLASKVLGHRLLPFDRSLDLHISKLRRKLGNRPDGRERIKTVRGIGYILTKDEV
jgi:DNA-binding response OmpR family regulator